jgi:heavy metal sensor kinase
MPSLQPTFSRAFRTIRVQLTLWNTFVVLLAVIMALVAVREKLRHSLLEEMDIILNDEVKELILSIQRDYPDLDRIQKTIELKAESHRERGWHIRWLDTDRNSLWVGPPENSPESPLAEEVGRMGEAIIWGSSVYHAVEREVKLPGVPHYYLRVGTKTEFIARDVWRLTQQLMGVGFALMLLAPLGGFLLADRALAPVKEIIATTERLRPSQLEERLTIRGVGDELDQLAEKINHLLDEIGEHLRRKRDFVANAAHELRTPVTAIQSSVEVALERPRTQAEYEDLLCLINDECRHLGQLVNQLLQLAEAQSDILRVSFAPVSLDDVVQRIVDMIAPVAEDRGVMIHYDCRQSADISGNRQTLRQLMTNLIENAVKFTPTGGRIDVTLDTDPHTRQVRIDVADTGIGIPEEDFPRIFDRFYQVEKFRVRGDESQGNGLGLSICQAIVQQHHGTIRLESTVGKGTRFIVTFPLPPSESN